MKVRKACPPSSTSARRRGRRSPEEQPIQSPPLQGEGWVGMGFPTEQISPQHRSKRHGRTGKKANPERPTPTSLATQPDRQRTHAVRVHAATEGERSKITEETSIRRS